MTRVLLPVFVAIVAVLGLITIVPIFIRELLYPMRRTRELDVWLEDVDALAEEAGKPTARETYLATAHPGDEVGGRDSSAR